MKFDIFKTLPLDYFGEDWKGCYLKFRYITVSEAKSFLSLQVNRDDLKSLEIAYDRAIEILSDKFVEGYLVVEGKRTKVSREDIKDLPNEIVEASISLLTTMDQDKKKD